MEDVWNSLDNDAKVNLSPADYRRYEEQKQYLLRSGESWAFAEDSLRGLIWDLSEETGDGTDL